ncbi:hypothetical protein ANOM_002395 [Aspergillus nomiae NRRL 13137]|uniref:F-box domain-containing protein n=1 Tax=Aspergillus nomiae NRRL (strain ATCC 15546 / NRRL 13137 / CBS 260.88 / M93) TaxID=1509407 RepID=A0A0L1JBB8_ASPN3|nr:uncharacterized protein ANOM_002395 [Aspergillus nomiae NRRL 13137]KNG89005.1 hypothetical protein ANOM_002395 [Aspergillus nomiae NRRL 13137]
MSILSLPVEVLLLIYQCLNDIDDALHLARTCKRLYTIFDSPLSRVNIFRCIIQSQDQHQYDTKLTIVQSCNPAYCLSPNSTTGHAQTASKPGPEVLHQALFAAHPQQLSDEQVWGIVCRWHGMRSLFSLYSDTAIHDIYMNNWTPWWHSQTPTLLGNDPLPQLSGRTIHDTSNQKRILYHRFYQALTSHWLSIECLALAKATVYPTPESRNEWHEIIYAQWCGQNNLSLREKLDILLVSLFVWEFLARKIFETIPLTPRLQEFRTSKVFLRPPSVIQALILQNWPDPDSMCDPVGYCDRSAPECRIQPVIVGRQRGGHESPENIGSENTGEWDMGLQDLESSTHDYLRRMRITPRGTWRSYWPATWGGSLAKRPRLGHAADGRLNIGVLDRLFLCPETDERVLIDLL